MRDFIFSRTIKTKFIAFFVMILLAGSVFSQTVYENSQDGKLFFKVKDNVLIKMPVKGNFVEISKVDFLQNLQNTYAIEQVSKAFHLKKMSERSRKVYIMEFNAFSEIDNLIEELEKVEIIEYAERVPLPKPLYNVNDPIYNNSNSGLNFNWHLDKLNAEAAWDIATGSSSVKVAIVDGAVWGDHEDLNISSNNLFTVTDYQGNGTTGTASPPSSVSQTVDPNNIQSQTSGYSWSHGTHCAGLVGATTNNSTGVASIGHGVTLMGVRTAEDDGSLAYTYLGAEWAAENGADVISMSYGGNQYSSSLEQFYEDIQTNYGCVLIAAAGNDGIDEQQYPAAFDCTIAVGMTDYDDELNYTPASGGYPESGSNYGTWVDIAAPGGEDGTMFSQGGLQLFSTTYCYNVMEANYLGGYSGVTGHYDMMLGTSMATPMAAGVIGLMLSVNPDLTQAEVLSCLQSTAAPIQGSHQIAANSGRIDAAAALECVQSGTSSVSANFSGSPTAIDMGQSVSFTDQSTTTSGSVNSWSWTITPSTGVSYINSTSASSQHPVVQFDNAGTYTVALTASNGSENDTETKTNYIVVTDPSAPATCDTMLHPLEGTMTLLAGQQQDGSYGGYITGTNVWGDKAKANYFENTTSGEVASMVVGIGKASGTSGNVRFSIWEDNGGSPGNELTSAEVALSELSTQYSTAGGGYYTLITFDTPINITGNFFAGVHIPTGASGDTIAIISNNNGDTNPGIAWELWSDDTWYSMVDAWSANIAMAIHPVLCPTQSSGDAPVAQFVGNPTTIDEGQSVTFTDQSTNSPTSWSWTISPTTGVSFINSTSASSQNPIVQFDNEGVYTVTLLAENGDGSDTEQKANYITVNATGTQEPGCDTLLYPLEGTMTLLAGQQQDGSYGGYITGTNVWGDKAKANYIENSASGEVASMVIGIGKASGTSGNVRFSIWEDNGGTPGNEIAYGEVALSDLSNQYNTAGGGFYTLITFNSPINVSGNFFAGVHVPTGASGDTIAIISNNNGDTNPGIAWEQWSDNTWYSMVDAWSANIAMAVHPVLCIETANPIALSESKELIIYPNPTSGKINFNLPEEKTTIEIYDYSGKIIVKKEYNQEGLNSIDLSDYPAGMYILRATTGTEVSIQRISKN